MTTISRASLWVPSVLLLWAAAGLAQSDPQSPAGPPPAHVSVVEGQAFIDREGRSEPAVANLPLLDGDRLRTADGRLEVILPDGSLLHVDRGTTVDVLATDLLRLLQGRVYVVARGAGDPQQAIRYQIDAPVASVQTGGPGEFRVWAADTARGREVELAVFRGRATIASSNGAEELRAGERSVVRDGLAPSTPQYFNSARWDEFDRWSAAQREEHVGTTAVQYLPPELTVYASTFDQYGTWRSDSVEGAVWYPTVAADWRPYSVGYWNTYPGWGSFWVGGDPWGWPTHHYGHWGFSFGFGWYWKPATVWGPAWVSWAYSPGYVSWCPLGRYGYPVFGHFGIRGHYYGNHVDPWHGWTVMPRRHYGTPTPVHHVAVDGHRLDPATRGAFAAGRPAEGLPRAAPRSNGSGLAMPRYASGGAASAPRDNLASAVPRRAGGETRPGTNASALPRPGVTRELPGARARLSPDEAARVLTGSAGRTYGSAARRPFPEAPAFGGSARERTDAPAATPDVTAFGSRRPASSPAARGSAIPGGTAQFGNGAPTRFGNGAPTRFGNGAPTQFGSGAPGIFGSGARARTYPRATPSAGAAGTGEASPPPAVRQNPYFRSGGDSGAVERRAYPVASEPTAGPRPRDLPYMRGGGESPAQSAPRDNPYNRGGGWTGPSARPRDTGGGGGLPSGPFTRGGGSSGSSAPPAAPRYNPGSGAPQPRGGGQSSPPPRHRGGAPD
jgi:hypothetical protein